MILQIDGINTLNKGAELMLVSILEELEKRFPGETIYLNPDSTLDSSMIPNYNLKIKRRIGLRLGRIINGVFFKLKLKQPIEYFNENYAVKEVDLILDASGFKYSDQWNRSNKWLAQKEKYYSQAKKNGTKIYFLTQAFGPFETVEGKKSIEILSKYCNLIFAREETSHHFLLNANADKNKVKVSCDFTLSTKGDVPKKFSHLQGAVFIIPNKKMITHGANKSDNYLNLLLGLIAYYKSKGETVVLLNHESEGDHKICKLINSKLDKDLEIITNENAKVIKGVIGLAKMVVSSRFHGVASSLSQGVPCLATSWNHKYEMLFKNFNQTDRVIDANKTIEGNIEKVDAVYNDYDAIQNTIKTSKKDLLDQISNMWDVIFKDYKQN